MRQRLIITIPEECYGEVEDIDGVVIESSTSCEGEETEEEDDSDQE